MLQRRGELGKEWLLPPSVSSGVQVGPPVQWWLWGLELELSGPRARRTSRHPLEVSSGSSHSSGPRLFPHNTSKVMQAWLALEAAT